MWQKVKSDAEMKTVLSVAIGPGNRLCLPAHTHTHPDNSQREQQVDVLMTLTLIGTKATAARLSKYILYRTRHSFSVCNLMFAIKNSRAASPSA